MLTLLVNAETGTRGYLLTRRDAFLEPYLAARKELPEPVATLRQLIQDNPSQLARLTRVEALIAATTQALDELRQNVAANRSQTGVGQMDGAKASMDALRRELAAMQEEEQRLLARHADRATEEQRLAFARPSWPAVWDVRNRRSTGSSISRTQPAWHT